MKKNDRSKKISSLWIPPPKDEDKEPKESSRICQKRRDPCAPPVCQKIEKSKGLATKTPTRPDNLKEKSTPTTKPSTKTPTGLQVTTEISKKQKREHRVASISEEEEFTYTIKDNFDFENWVWQIGHSGSVDYKDLPLPPLSYFLGLPYHQYGRFSDKLSEYNVPDHYSEAPQEDPLPKPEQKQKFTFCPFKFQALIEEQFTSDEDKTLDDATLITEFTDLYGPVDTENKLFQKLFFRFKQQRMEEIETNKKFNVTRSTQNGPQKDFPFLPPMHELLDFETETNHENYKKFLKEKGREWFLLPRPNISLDHIQIMDKAHVENIEAPIISILSPEEENEGSSPSKNPLNLTLFDPRFKMDNIIMEESQPTGGYTWHETIKVPLRRRFAQLMDKYPMGISVEGFLSAFKKENGYYPAFRDANYFSFEDLAIAHPDIFYVVSSPLKETLLFPSYFQYLICQPIELFYKVWTKIQIELSLNNYILPLDIIPSKLADIFKTDFSPIHWCYIDNRSYYNFCLKRWPPDEWTSIEPDPNDPNKLLLIQKNEKVPETLEYYKRFIVEKKRIANEKQIQDELKKVMSSVPKQYVRLNEKVKLQAKEITPGTHMKCLGGWIINPGNFYVNLGQFWHQLEALMNQMQMYYMRMLLTPDNEKATPEPHQLMVGLLVAVKRKVDCEWHRARILEKIDEDTIIAFFIDYGDTVTAKRHNVRFLHRDFLREMNAQAVKCCIKLGPAFRNLFPLSLEGDGWTEKEGDIFQEMIDDNDLAISFKESIIIDGVLVWQVYVHILKEKSCDILIHHVERQLLKLERKIEIQDTEESEKHLVSVELAKINPWKEVKGNELERLD